MDVYLCVYVCNSVLPMHTSDCIPSSSCSPLNFILPPSLSPARALGHLSCFWNDVCCLSPEDCHYVSWIQTHMLSLALQWFRVITSDHRHTGNYNIVGLRFHTSKCLISMEKGVSWDQKYFESAANIGFVKRYSATVQIEGLQKSLVSSLEVEKIGNAIWSWHFFLLFTSQFISPK